MNQPSQTNTTTFPAVPVLPLAGQRPAHDADQMNGQLDTLFSLIRRATGATYVSFQTNGAGPQGVPHGLGACLNSVVMRDDGVIGVLRAFAPRAEDFRPGAAEMVEDCANLVAEQLALWTAARIDPLTGAMARGAFTETLEQRLAGYRRTGEPCSLIMLDLDRFKAINDTYGHAAGDAVLRVVSDSIRSQLRAEDSFGRLGGEEFAVVVRGDCSAARDVAERLRAAVAQAPVPEQLRGKVSASFGVAMCNADCREADALMIEADTQLYRAKRDGRNRVSVAFAADPRSARTH